MKNYSFKSSVYSGDTIFLLSGIKHVCETQGVKAELYLWLDRPMKSYDGANHPYGTSGINEYVFKMLKPLIEAQPYIEFCREWHGETVAVDLDELRQKTIAPMPYGSIVQWPGYAWPDMQGDTSKPWVNAMGTLYTSQGIKQIHPVTSKELPTSIAKGKIIINRTSRYQNSMIHYWFLREKQNLIFAGLPEEHADFCKQWELDIPLLEVHDFLELAIALKSCWYFIGNQSMCMALAEAMKIPRLLEVCYFAPNVVLEGEHGYYFGHQFALEWFVKDEASPLNKL